MKLNFNYNTKASFDFDNKIKLKYDSEKFNEDAIPVSYTHLTLPTSDLV